MAARSKTDKIDFMPLVACQGVKDSAEPPQMGTTAKPEPEHVMETTVEREGGVSTFVRSQEKPKGGFRIVSKLKSVHRVLQSIYQVLKAVASLLVATCGALYKVFTFGNIAKVFLIQTFLLSPAATTTKSTLEKFSPKQHFVFEPIGYHHPTTFTSLPGIEAATGSASSTKKMMTGALSYYFKDTNALNYALNNAPVYKKPQAERTILKPTTSIFEEIEQNCTVENELEKEFADAGNAFQKFEAMQSSLPDSKETRGTTIVLDLSLGRDPKKKIPYIKTAVNFLIGYARHRSSQLQKNHPLEVVVRLESGGGYVHSYGQVAEQLRRLRSQPDMILTIASDLVAASGGYMVAATATPGQLLASPFAVVGSVGVVTGASLNIQEALESVGIKTIQTQSGHRKGSKDLVLGKVTEEDLEHMQAKSDRSHQLFLDYVEELRGDKITDMETVMSGDDWLGKDAYELGLIDRLVTSEEYLDEKFQSGDRVLLMKHNPKQDKSGFWTTVLEAITAANNEEGEEKDDGGGNLIQATISEDTVMSVVSFFQSWMDKQKP